MSIRIEDLRGGEVLEAINAELERAIENIRDPNTEAEKGRSVNIALKLKPDENRELVATSVEVTSKLASLQKPIGLRLIVTPDDADEWQNPQRDMFEDDGKVVPFGGER